MVTSINNKTKRMSMNNDEKTLEIKTEYSLPIIYDSISQKSFILLQDFPKGTIISLVISLDNISSVVDGDFLIIGKQIFFLKEDLSSYLAEVKYLV